MDCYVQGLKNPVNSSKIIKINREWVSQLDNRPRDNRASGHQSHRKLNKKPTMAIQSPSIKECAHRGIVQQTFIQRAAHFV